MEACGYWDDSIKECVAHDCSSSHQISASHTSDFCIPGQIGKRCCNVYAIMTEDPWNSHHAELLGGLGHHRGWWWDGNPLMAALLLWREHRGWPCST